MTKIISSRISDDKTSAIIEYIDNSNVRRIISVPCCTRDEKTNGKTWRDVNSSDFNDTVVWNEYSKYISYFTDNIKNIFKNQNNYLM